MVAEHQTVRKKQPADAAAVEPSTSGFFIIVIDVVVIGR